MNITEARSSRRGPWSIGNVCVPKAFGIVGPIVVVAVLVLAGCSSDSESPDVEPTAGVATVASPTAVVAAQTAEPTPTVASGAASTATEAPAAAEAPAATATTVPPTATSLIVGEDAASSVAAEPTPPSGTVAPSPRLGGHLRPAEGAAEHAGPGVVRR